MSKIKYGLMTKIVKNTLLRFVRSRTTKSKNHEMEVYNAQDYRIYYIYYYAAYKCRYTKREIFEKIIDSVKHFNT